VGVFQVLGLAIGLHFLLPAYRSAAGQKALRWVEDHPASAVVTYGRSAVGETRWTALLARTGKVRDLSLEGNYSELAGLGPICAPFGDPAVYAVLARHTILKTEYYYSLVNVFTPEQLERKIADIRSCSYLLLSQDSLADEGQSPSRAVRDSGTALGLQWNLCFPWLPPLREPSPPDPFVSVSAVIRSEYVATKQLNQRWVLWVRHPVIGR
jgi:hypothetical protein